MKISVLDLCPVFEGDTVAHALKSAIDLAQHLESLDFPRVWYAEHHNMTGIASAATSVVMGQVLAATRKIIVGSGGIMLPNHAPLVVAEQFGTLASLYPKRVELGVGRAPGTDPMTSRALRRSLETDPNDFPRDVVEVLNYFKQPTANQKLRAVPGAGTSVPVWILGSSLFGAQLAAVLGLPYAFASHFAPAELSRAVALYRERFEPSAYLDKPHVMVALNAVIADSDAEAHYLFSSLQQSFVNLRTGRAGPLPKPIENYTESLSPQKKMMLDQALSCSVLGAPQTVHAKLRQFIEQTCADEFIVTSPVFDRQKRAASFTHLANMMKQL